MRFAFIALVVALLTVSHAAFAQAVPQSQQALSMSFAPLVKKTGPAVVNIYTKRIVRERLRLISPFMNDPFFNQFFGGMGGVQGGVRERVENSLGSGVIVDPSGIIATNSHVIKEAQEIVVVTSDGQEYVAQKQLVDEDTDLAILRIDTKGKALPTLALADSDAIEVGDIVLAIGNPFGLGQTVTSGIVSGLARTGVGPSEYGFFIQTDAAINPGNSGGALIDVQGRLIGINSMIFSRTGASHGIGFAIPANMVKTVVESARSGAKTVIRPWTGFGGQTVSPDMVESLGLTRAAGVLVNRVRAKSPAEAAGLRVGDVITAVNAFEVKDPQALHFRLATIGIGVPVELKVVRAGAEKTLTLKTAQAPEIPPRQTIEISGVNPLQGAVVANLSPAVAHEIGSEEEEGIVVLSAEKGVAARLGLQRGDIIAAINGKTVKDVSGLQALLKAAGQPRRWQVGILRKGQVLNFVVAG